MSRMSSGINDTDRTEERECDGVIYIEVDGSDVEIPCTFEGEVDVTYSDFAEYWTCPQCQGEHEREYHYMDYAD